MLDEWWQTWELFAATWVSTWVLAALLALLGITIIARGAVFQGLAIAQVNAAAVAGMLCLGSFITWVDNPWIISVVTLFIGVVTALIVMRHRRSEQVNALLYLISGAAIPLLLMHSPHGLSDVQHIITSQLIGATWNDAMIISGILTLVGFFTWYHFPALRLVVMDPHFARDLALPYRRIEFIIALSLGVGIGIGLRVAGLLYVTGCLILPILFANRLCHNVSQIFCWAPIIAVASALLGTVISHLGDFPLAPTIVFVQALLVLGGWIMPRKS
jgi:ABC-type Mn2+/Zn2+ transport system permease subunit